MSDVSFLAVSLFLLVTLTSADPIESTSAAVDVTLGAKELVKELRTVIAQAKNGVSLDPFYQRILDLQGATADFIQQLPGEVSECETQFIIKMAAAGTGSHEVLTVMLADDPLGVLNGRLSLALAFLEHVAQQLENELSLSSEIGPHLAAVMFGTNTTAAVIEAADNTVKTLAMASSDDHHRVRRQSLNLRNGWSVGANGVTWQNRRGNLMFNARPTLGSGGFGARATFTIRF